MKIFNGTPHEINVVVGATFDSDLRKYIGGDVAATLPSDGALNANIDTIEVAPVDGVPVFDKKINGYDALPLKILGAYSTEREAIMLVEKLEALRYEALKNLKNHMSQELQKGGCTPDYKMKGESSYIPDTRYPYFSEKTFKYYEFREDMEYEELRQPLQIQIEHSAQYSRLIRRIHNIPVDLFIQEVKLSI